MPAHSKRSHIVFICIVMIVIAESWIPASAPPEWASGPFHGEETEAQGFEVT